MQPFETLRPIDHGSFVPWIAIGPPFAFSVSKRAKEWRPGERYARVGRRTTAAQARRVDPTAWKPDAQERVMWAPSTPPWRLPPQPAAASRSTTSDGIVTERLITPCSPFR